MEEFGAEIISITDEDGVEYELEVLARVEHEGFEYLALTPANASDEAEELEVSLLKSVIEDGEPILVAIEDEDELETVYDLLMEDVFGDEDEEEELYEDEFDD